MGSRKSYNNYNIVNRIIQMFYNIFLKIVLLLSATRTLLRYIKWTKKSRNGLGKILLQSEGLCQIQVLANYINRLKRSPHFMCHSCFMILINFLV